MKKIMFNDGHGLTQAVLEERKTQTRRIVPQKILDMVPAYQEEYYAAALESISVEDAIYNITHGEKMAKAPFYVGEEVAIAQRYWDVMKYYHSLGHVSQRRVSEEEYVFWNAMRDIERYGDDSAMLGDANKMFVRAHLMPHRIKITDVHVERLQAITYENCLKEGISISSPPLRYMDGYWQDHTDKLSMFNTPRAAFAALIDKVSGKGTWDSNPLVFVYDFQLIK